MLAKQEQEGTIKILEEHLSKKNMQGNKWNYALIDETHNYTDFTTITYIQESKIYVCDEKFDAHKAFKNNTNLLKNNQVYFSSNALRDIHQ